jgi:hypothetical protein
MFFNLWKGRRKSMPLALDMSTASYETFASASIFGISAYCVLAWKRQLNSTRRHHTSLHGLVRHVSSYSDWSDFKLEDEQFIRDLPKVELHVVSYSRLLG